MSHAAGQGRRGRPELPRTLVGLFGIEGVCVLQGRDSADELRTARLGSLVAGKHVLQGSEAIVHGERRFLKACARAYACLYERRIT